jgi:hypothetical protein
MFSTATRASLMLSVWLLAATAQSVAQQQPACRKLQAVQGAYGYQARAKDVRCEGFYESPVAAAALDLVSLTAGPVDYKLEGQESVRLTAPDVSSLKSDQVNIQAHALPLGTYYRMDAVVPSAGSLNWRIGDVLRPHQLTADRIGIFGWVDQTASRTFVPVLISEQNTRAPVVILLRPSIDLERVHWRSWPDGGSQQGIQWKSIPNAPQMRRAGELIKLEFERDKGIKVVEVSAKTANSDRWLSLKFHIFEP